MCCAASWRGRSRFAFEMRAIAYDYPTQLDVEFQRKVRTRAGLFQVVPAIRGCRISLRGWASIS
jgi:hypothetical protein